MDTFTLEWFSALLSILIIDLVLAGDNAIVIGLAARNVPKNKQKRVIVLGTLGAIFIRVLATLSVLWLLKIPGLLAIGGVLLLWIAYTLVTSKKKQPIAAKNSVIAAVFTIIAADAAMGIDNVLAVAGAANSDFLLVIIGLGLSVPIVVWGSTFIMHLTERYPWIILIGGGVLAFTAAKMITSEPYFGHIFHSSLVKWSVIITLIVIIVLIGLFNRAVKIKTNKAA